MSLKVVGIAGSLRAESFNRQLLKAIIHESPDNWQLNELSLDALPHYNYDVQTAGLPASVKDFREQIIGADAAIICTPEYNFAVSGVLKNALDWCYPDDLPSAFDEKPVAISGASSGQWGTVRSQENLRSILAAMNAYVMPAPYLRIAKAKTKFKDGQLVDAADQKMLQTFVKASDKFFSIFK